MGVFLLSQWMLQNLRSSFYAALANYMTVGCSINSPQKCQLLRPMSGGTGMLMFGPVRGDYGTGCTMISKSWEAR